VLCDGDHVRTGDCLASAALISPVRPAPLPPRPDPVSSWRPLSMHLKVFPCRRRVTPASLHVPEVCRCHRCVAADASATSRRPGFRLACGSAHDVRAGRALARRRGQSGASPSISAGGCPTAVLRGSSSSTSSSGPSSFVAADPGGKMQKEEDRLHACLRWLLATPGQRPWVSSAVYRCLRDQCHQGLPRLPQLLALRKVCRVTLPWFSRASGLCRCRRLHQPTPQPS
jgi:hypothetical protein